MNGSVYILLNKTLRQQNRILVVITFPGHKANQRVLTQSNLTVLSRRTVSDNLAGLYMIILVYNRLLVVAVGLVASLKLGQMINITAAVVIPLDNNLVGCRTLNHTGMLCQHTYAGVNSCLCLNTGSYNRSLCA